MYYCTHGNIYPHLIFCPFQPCCQRANLRHEEILCINYLPLITTVAMPIQNNHVYSISLITWFFFSNGEFQLTSANQYVQRGTRLVPADSHDPDRVLGPTLQPGEHHTAVRVVSVLPLDRIRGQQLKDVKLKVVVHRCVRHCQVISANGAFW